MNKIEYRGLPLYMVILVFILLSVFVSFSVWAIVTLLPICDTMWLKILLIGFPALFFVLPMIAFFLYTVFQYATKILVTEDGVTMCRLGKKHRHLPRSSITFLGVASSYPRSAMLFFCAVPVEEIMAYNQAHPQYATALYGSIFPDPTNTVQQDPNAALGVLLRKGCKAYRDKLIYTENIPYKVLVTASRLLGMPITLTGRMLICGSEIRKDLERHIRSSEWEIDRVK